MSKHTAKTFYIKHVLQVIFQAVMVLAAACGRVTVTLGLVQPLAHCHRDFLGAA
jgi:hypothetical protein